QNLDAKRYVDLRGLSILFRQNIFHITQLLDNKQENQAIDSLLNFKKLGDNILNGDVTLGKIITGLTIEQNTNEQVVYILENYLLSQENLEKIQKYYDSQFDVHSIYSNILKGEYQSNKDNLLNNGFENQILFNIDEYGNEYKKVIQYLIDGNKYPYPFEYNYLKRTLIYDFFIFMSIGSVDFSAYKQDIIELNSKQKEILEKINLQIK
ncbi:hypothetical protein LR004_01810, partial [Candidatus Gracilibacteria bacterium]|nr:hypothetical protein [Candidatus Gracilibacteria bacterium]